MDKSLTTNETFKFSSTELIAIKEPTVEEIKDIYKWLKYAEGAIHWWIGDLMRIGEEVHGDKIYQLMEENDFVMGTARNDKWVATAIPASLRREPNVLSHSHHVEVASLEPDQQDELLDLAEQEKLTTRQLRQKVRAVKMQNDDNDTEQYQKMIGTVINIIDILNKNYPAGIVEIKMYLENSI